MEPKTKSEDKAGAAGAAPACQICGNRDPKAFSFVTDKFRYEVKKSAYKCDACGLVFILPLMSPEEERIFYEQEYGVIYSQEKGTTPKDLFEKRLPDARRYLSMTERYLSGDNDCLEIGCASGYFLHTIRDRVRSVAGYETHVELKKYCEGIGIPILPSLEAAGEGRFDRIFLFFVLEHLGDPLGYLALLKRMLRPGGILFIEVPNVDDALLSLYQIPALKDFYFTPAHQFYYSKDTLGRLLRKAGFADFEIEPEQRYDLSNHMHWMLAGKPGGQGKYSHVFTPKLLEAYAECLREKFLCDTLFAVVKKDK